MSPRDYVQRLIPHVKVKTLSAAAFAPSNIALCKYWGKRDTALNLPETGSLSIALGDLGTSTQITLSDTGKDYIEYAGKALDEQSSFYRRVVSFLDLFRESGQYFQIKTSNTVPLAAGLASSASGFAALVKALDSLYAWQLDLKTLSILARLGSGSASRSFWPGFVEWHRGEQADGLDSYAEPIETRWPDFCLGLILLSTEQKPRSSREAMKESRDTSPYYAAWPDKVRQDIAAIKPAIADRSMEALGQIAEQNALCMHALMHTAIPPTYYALPETLAAMQAVWVLRKEGVPVYFTQDAGPNLKLLFEKSAEASVRERFPDMIIVEPFK